MAKADRLLKIKDLSIEEIAEMTGYENIYHFSNTFKKHFGISPSSYRKQPYEIAYIAVLIIKRILEFSLMLEKFRILYLCHYISYSTPVLTRLYPPVEQPFAS